MKDPITRFGAWLDEAKACETIVEPTAMSLATCTASRRPSVRIVLLKQADERGFVFYTNLTSRKSVELKENPYAALCFYWMPLDKQVRVEGAIVRVDDAEADAYFASRKRGSQMGAWASDQSAPLASREELEARVAAMEAEYEGRDVPRPAHWGGWRLVPERIEFWQQLDFRLHHREVFTRTQDGWESGLLYP